MINRPIPSLDVLDWEACPPDTIELLPEHIEQAIQRCQLIPDADQQWQIYLHGLALAGFEQWLADRAPELPINRDRCSLLQPQYASLIEVVSHLRVGDFTVCLLAVGSLTDAIVSLPKAVVDLPQFTDQFYVLIEVLEEQEQMRICGFLAYDQLISQQRSNSLTANSNWTYPVPLNWFQLEADRLLLSLRCLEPTAIPLPAAVPQSAVSLTALQTKLTELLPQLQSASRPLWQLLTWEEMTLILTQPQLAEWLYQAQSNQASQTIQIPLQQRLTDILTNLQTWGQTWGEQAINAAAWLQNQMDDLAQQLSWVLLPTPALAPVALRSTSEEWNRVVEELARNRVVIPATAGRAYRDFVTDGMALRLYAVTWTLEVGESEGESASEPEWILLLVLGAQPGNTLPSGVKLQVRDETQLLVERQLTAANRGEYLYAQVIGSQTEQFSVAIGLQDDTLITLPPFAFRPN